MATIWRYKSTAGGAGVSGRGVLVVAARTPALGEPGSLRPHADGTGMGSHA